MGSQSRRQSTVDRLLETVERIYGSILDPSERSATLGAVCDLVQGSATMAFVTRARENVLVSYDVHNLNPEAAATYDAYWFRYDTRWSASSAYPAGSVFTEEVVGDARAFRASAIYNELLLPNDAPHILATRPLNSSEYQSCVSVQGGRRRGPFTEAERRVFGRIVPHLRRAMEIRLRLDGYVSRLNAVLEAVDALSFGLVLLDEAGELQHVSRTAREILAAADGLIVRGRRLAGVRPPVRKALAAALARTDRPAGATLSVERSAGPPLTVYVFPVGGAAGDVIAVPARWVVLIVDPVRMAAAPADRLQRAFAVTPAEAALLARLLAGDSLTAAAQALQRSRETVRTQLKTIYRKTGCRTQSELMRRMIAGTGALSPSCGSQPPASGERS